MSDLTVIVLAAGHGKRMKSKLPKVGQPKSDHYEGDGYVIVRHPDDEVVKAAMKTIIETIRIEYA